MPPGTIIGSLQVVALVVLALGQPTLAGFTDWFLSVVHKPDQMVADFDLLNSELVAMVERDTAKDNLEEALDWLKMWTGQMALKPGLQLPSELALIRFTKLIGLMDLTDPKCGLGAYNILYANELATGTDISVTPEELPAQRRVEAVIYEVALQHAIQCRYVYPEQFARARKLCDEAPMKDIQRMMNAMIGTSKRVVFTPRDRPMDPRHMLARKARGITGTGPAEARELLMHVRISSRHDPETRFLKVLPDPRKRQHWIVNEGKVVQLLDRFVYARCEFLQDKFEHIFKPADFDQQLFSENNKYRAINEKMAEMMVWLEYYRLCQSMLANKRELNANVLAAIWSELTKSTIRG